MNQINYKYKIIKNLNNWSKKYPLLAKSLEDIISLHRDGELFTLQKFYDESSMTEFPGQFRIIIIHDGDKIIGCARSELIKKSEPTTYLISAVHIDKDYRRLGLCKLLIKKLLNSYDKINGQKYQFVLSVMATNTSAIKCYEANGFVSDNKNVDGAYLMKCLA